MVELNSSSFIFLMYCNNSAFAAFYSLINKGLVQHGVISNAHIIPERTNSKRMRGRGEAQWAICTSISPPIGASDECTPKYFFIHAHQGSYFQRIRSQKEYLINVLQSEPFQRILRGSRDQRATCKGEKNKIKYRGPCFLACLLVYMLPHETELFVKPTALELLNLKPLGIFILF